MPTSILIKRSSTASAVPTTSDITTGELAVNTVDKRIFTNNSGTIVELGTNPTSLAVAGTLSAGGAATLASGTVSGNWAVTGTLTVATPVNSTDAASKGYVDAQVSAVLDSAPAALDTLNELAAAINDDANFAGTVTTALAGKLSLSGGTMTGDIDLGANSITSTATPTTDNELTRKGYVDSILGSATSAATSASEAATSASNAANSATSASTSASTATTQASAAATSATNAATSASAAASSATSASNSATASATSATQAASSATAASDSADEAEASATAAAASATEAATVVAGAVQSSGDTMTGNLNFGDNDKAVFGAGSDLQIYHDGANSYIQEYGTGNLILGAGNTFEVRSSDNITTGAVFNAYGSVDLNYNGSTKLATTSTGVDVTGTVSTDRATGTVTTDNDLSFDMSASNNFACTPSGTGTLTFTNITAGQSGNIYLNNSGGHAISAAATVLISAGDLSKLSTAGAYFVSYYSADGTNVAVSVSSAVTSAGA